MIRRQKEKYGWEFLFLATNIDAVKAVAKIGIDSSRTVNYLSDAKGTRLNYEVLSEAITSVRCCEALPDDWARRIDEDDRERE